ncbi:MAG: hypothetical protein ACKOX6_03540 [Bdellovibrio sp.]
MKQTVISVVLLFLGSLGFANTCDSFPKEGHVAVPIVLEDGTEILFRAILQIEHVNSFKERVITHRYNHPQVFVGNKEVAVTAAGLDGIAKAMGYDGLGFREMGTNAGILRKRKTLTTVDENLILAKSPKALYVISPLGFGIFHHRQCAPWMFN